MVPVPDAEVLTGGTSWLPDRLSFKPSALVAIAIGHANKRNVKADATDKALIV
jgi:hypothetical protein